jgi:hypothetical protein
MDHVRAIQVSVDEYKEQMPTEVVRVAMEECQKVYDIMSNLYKLNWTVVNKHAQVHMDENEGPFAQVELSHTTQTLIVEAVDHLPDYSRGGKIQARDMPNHGMVLKYWLEKTTPFVMHGNNMVIIHSIVPYNPHKRSREE